MEASRQLSCSHLFSSSLSVTALATSVAQLAETAFTMSRDLLLLLSLLIRLAQQVCPPYALERALRHYLKFSEGTV